MPVDISLRTQPDLLIVTFSGASHMAEIIATLAHIRADARITSMTPRLWDMRAATFRLSASEIRDIVRWLSHRPPAEHPQRLAIVARPGTLTYGLLRMLQSYMEVAHVPTELYLCAEPPPGLAWLGLNPMLLDPPESWS
jgi:hypothetical protein